MDLKRNHPLKAWRKANGFTQEALAEHLKVAGITVSRWETGERNMSPHMVCEVSQLTGIAPSELRPDLGEFVEQINRLSPVA